MIRHEFDGGHTSPVLVEGLVGATAGISAPTLFVARVENAADQSGWVAGVATGPMSDHLVIPVNSYRRVMPNPGIEALGVEFSDGHLELHGHFFAHFPHYRLGEPTVGSNGEIVPAQPTVLTFMVGKHEVLGFLRSQKDSKNPHAATQALASLRALTIRANRGEDFSLSDPDVVQKRPGISMFGDPLFGGSSRRMSLAY